MANAWVTQFRSTAVINDQVVDAPRALPIRVEQVPFSAVPGVTVSAIGSDCELVSLHVDTNANWVGGDAPTATASDAPIFAGAPFFFVPSDLQKFSFVGTEAPVLDSQFTPQLFLLLMGS